MGSDDRFVRKIVTVLLIAIAISTVLFLMSLTLSFVNKDEKDPLNTVAILLEEDCKYNNIRILN